MSAAVEWSSRWVQRFLDVLVHLRRPTLLAVADNVGFNLGHKKCTV